MISAWHLLWIIPVAASFGMILTAIIVVGKNADKDSR
jgi:hypothetical protein